MPDDVGFGSRPAAAPANHADCSWRIYSQRWSSHRALHDSKPFVRELARHGLYGRSVLAAVAITMSGLVSASSRKAADSVSGFGSTRSRA